MTPIQIARVVHATNSAYCKAVGDPVFAFATVKASIIAGITALQDNPDATPEQMHQKWCEFKVNDGWVYGETKDAEKKTHPNLVDYNKLSEEQRVKDSLFQGVVRPLLVFLKKPAKKLAKEKKM